MLTIYEEFCPMIIKYARHVAFIFVLLFALMSQPATGGDSIKWVSYKEGMAVAPIEKKKIFLHFYADWCVYCGKMAKESFQNPDVIAALNKDFISIRVNSDHDMETAMKYGVRGLPYTVFLMDTGETLGSIAGYIPPEPLLAMLKEAKSITADSLNQK